MPVSEVLEAVTVADEVAAPGETVGSVDLTTVSQQLDTLTALEYTQVGVQIFIMGLILGAVVARIIRRMWE